eukprot:gene2133-2170_t
MKRYVLRKVLMLPLVVLGVSVLVFFVVRLLPGDPARLMAGPEATQEAVDNMQIRLGLDRDVVTQYLSFLWHALQGDLGISIKSKLPVAREIAERFPNTLALAVCAYAGATLVGVPAGMVAAVRKGGWPDQVVMLGAIAGASIAHFWLGLMAMNFFAVDLGWLPLQGAESWRNQDDVPISAARERLRWLWRRRTLCIGALLVGAVVLSALAAPLLTLNAPDAQDLVLRVGLIGPGVISTAHAASIAEVNGLHLVAVAGGTEARARAAIAGAFAYYADPAEMLRDTALDAVVVTSPSGLHFAHACLALSAGCHVMVEKPLSVDAADAARLVALADQSGKVCATISQRRFEPQHRALKDLLIRGALGQPRLIHADAHWWRPDDYYASRPWRGEIAQGGGSLLNQGIHSLDLMLFLFGPVLHVAAQCTTLGHDLAVEDTTTALLHFESGAQGTLVTTTATPPGRPAGLRVFTSGGSVELSGSEITRWDMKDVPPPAPDGVGHTGLAAQWCDFEAAVRTNRPAAITFADGCDAVRVTAAIYRAAEQGRRVMVGQFPPA